jgi:2-C-methyl-D-erythritol 4-phosphate cytidylyltransferase
MEISLVIVAAGKGVRLGGVDKAFIKIAGKEIILYSFETLSQVSQIRETIVVVNRMNIEKARKVFAGYNVQFVLGGKTRAESVKAGVLKAQSDFVMIHDAARPFVSKKLVERIISAMEDTDCVIPGLTVKPTIKVVENGFVSKTLDRSKLINVQTPQFFRRKILLEAYDKFQDFDVTDESTLIERMSKEVKVVSGEEKNIKITTPFDLILAEEIIKSGI